MLTSLTFNMHSPELRLVDFAHFAQVRKNIIFIVFIKKVNHTDYTSKKKIKMFKILTPCPRCPPYRLLAIVDINCCNRYDR